MLDGAYGGEQAAQGEEDGKALMADVRSMSPQRPVEQQRVREPLYEAPNDRSAPLPAASFDAAALERVAASRVKDTKQATEEMGLNRVEPAIEHKQQHKLEVDEETTRTSGVKTTEASQSDPPKTAMPGGPAGNYVDSDEVFTASKADVRSIVPVEVEQKYLRIGDKYYHPKNRDVVAFEDKGNKLETRSNSEQVGETMVTIARARS